MIPDKSERVRKVEEFRNECLRGNFTEPAPHVYELRGSGLKTLTLCTLIHGNEIGGMEVFLKLIQDVNSGKLKLRSNLRMILGNVNAYLEDKRYLETDMNRSFGLVTHRTDEEKRARLLEGFIRDSHVLVDIHQTIGPTTTPFFIFEYDKNSYNFARYLHGKIPVVTNSGKRLFKGQTSTAFAISKGTIAVTIETGQKGIDDTQISLGYELAKKALETDYEHIIPEAGFSDIFTFSQIIDNTDGTLELLKEHQNFGPVNKGEILARNSEKELRSEVDGVILFPKYGAYAKASPELALILKTVHSPDEIS